MKTFQGLEDFGINILTGERCAFSMRLLCDMNADGVALVQDFLGLPVMSSFEKNWNSFVNGQEAVASIMLTREMIPGLIRFAIFRKGYRYMFGDPEGWNYTAYNDVDLEGNHALQMAHDGELKFIPNGRRWTNPKPLSKAPSVGTCNIHAFTGR
jgi:hypothetical protein